MPQNSIAMMPGKIMEEMHTVDVENYSFRSALKIRRVALSTAHVLTYGANPSDLGKKHLS